MLQTDWLYNKSKNTVSCCLPFVYVEDANTVKLWQLWYNTHTESDQIDDKMDSVVFCVETGQEKSIKRHDRKRINYIF